MIEARSRPIVFTLASGQVADCTASAELPQRLPASATGITAPTPFARQSRIKGRRPKLLPRPIATGIVAFFRSAIGTPSSLCLVDRETSAASQRDTTETPPTFSRRLHRRDRQPRGRSRDDFRQGVFRDGRSCAASVAEANRRLSATTISNPVLAAPVAALTVSACAKYGFPAHRRHGDDARRCLLVVPATVRIAVVWAPDP